MSTYSHTSVEIDVTESVNLPSPSSRSEFIAATTLLTLVFVLPICFGGVHETTWRLTQTLSFGAAAAWCVLSWRALPSIFALKEYRVLKSCTVIALLLSMYVCAQSFILNTYQESHPVLGQYAPRGVSTPEAMAMITAIAWFFTVAGLSASLAVNGWRTFINNAIIGSGVLCALIGLSHWLSDDGRLFWYFEPEHVELSQRARWPFVNPNNFAAFIVMGFTIAAAQLSELYHRLSEQLIHDRISIAQLLNSDAPDRRVVAAARLLQRCAILLGCVLIQALALLAAQSRGGWLAGVMGLTAIFVIRWLTTSRREVRGGTRRRLPRSHHARRKWLMRVGALLFVTGSLYVALNSSERSRALVENRVAFGLTSSLSDIRWQLARTSMPLLFQYPVLGLGIGNWAKFYPQQANAEMAGLNPVFLHCDPLQFVIEWGCLGGLLWVLSVLYALNASGRFTKARVQRSAGSIAALLAVITASVVDFPFHIPAMLAVVAILFGSLTAGESRT